jgi:hypothetical protein
LSPYVYFECNHSFLQFQIWIRNPLHYCNYLSKTSLITTYCAKIYHYQLVLEALHSLTLGQWYTKLFKKIILIIIMDYKNNWAENVSSTQCCSNGRFPKQDLYKSMSISYHTLKFYVTSIPEKNIHMYPDIRITNCIRFNVLIMTVIGKMKLLWDVTLCSSIDKFWRNVLPLKHWYLSTKLYGVTSHRTIITANPLKNWAFFPISHYKYWPGCSCLKIRR